MLAAGATMVNDLRGNWGPGTGWAVLADPEGNEFCVLRTPAEKAATADRFVCGSPEFFPLGPQTNRVRSSPRVAAAPPVEPDRGQRCCPTPGVSREP